jgi:simple sugar transport system ATP-binding protein
MATDVLLTGHKRIDHLQMQGIVKRFPGVLAADHIDFDVRAGEIHALLGENGAGKSTLMKMLYGLYKPDEGQTLINGEPSPIKSPSQAIEHGIGMIHQHFMLVPSLTVAENVALGMKSSRGLRLDLDVVAQKLTELSQRYNLKVNPTTPIWQLAVGEQQRVEILRAIYKGAALLILDEPTAVLTPQEVDDLFQILRKMAQDGHALIFISHKLHEVLAISNRITVLRDGRKVDTIPTESATKPLLAEMMVGRPVVLRYEYTAVETGDERLTLQNVSAISNRGDLGLKNISLSVRAGEIVGVAGVSGNGQQELAQVIAGLRPITDGTISIDGQDVTGKPPAKMNLLGLSYIPEERMIDGVIKEFTVAENLVLQDHGRPPFIRGRFFMNFRAITAACKKAILDYEIKTPGPETRIKNLSGGNIQKLVLARELSRNPRVLIAAQPTRGVDIGATEYIHRRLLAERKNGVAILLISEDLDEIQALSDRILIMYEGQIVGEVDRDNIDLRQIGAMMAGATAH